MRILHLISYYKPAWKLGGPVQSTSRLCEELAAQGALVDVLTTDCAGPGERVPYAPGQPHDIDGVRVTYLRSRGYWRHFFAPDLPAVLRKTVADYDIVHVTGSFTYFQIAWRMALAWAAVPFVVSPRGSFMANALNRGLINRLKKGPFIRLVERPVMQRAAGIHCVTEMEREAVQRNFPNAPTFVVPNGIATGEFSALPQRGAFRKSVGIGLDDFVFLYLGRLHRHKGIDLTIRAFSQAFPHESRAPHLVLAGNPEFGSDRPWRDLAAREQVAERVHFIGHVSGPDKLQCLADADASVLNSYSENFSISIAEAVLCGLPVIVSDQAGIADWVRTHDAGLVAAQDVGRIAEAMRRMVADAAQFQAGARTASPVAAQDFDDGAVAARMLEIYRRVAADAASSSPRFDLNAG